MSEQRIKDLGTVLDKAFTFIAKQENAPLYNAILSFKRYDGNSKYIPNEATGEIPLLGEYKDPSGNRTYGFGLEIRTANNVGGVIPATTVPEMELQFKERIQKDIDFVNKLTDAKGKRLNLDINQKAALTSLVYNIGQTGFLNSKAYKEGLAVGDIDRFKKEAFDSKIGFVKDKKGGTILDGLVNRRQAELELFETAQRERTAETNPMVDMTKIEPEPLKDRQITRAELAARRAGVNTN
tara:strand:- start:1144 stop:1860 length:717 start_codon:yes stop_codon:yes gene_type:complete